MSMATKITVVLLCKDLPACAGIVAIDLIQDLLCSAAQSHSKCHLCMVCVGVVHGEASCARRFYIPQPQQITLKNGILIGFSFHFSRKTFFQACDLKLLSEPYASYYSTYIYVQLYVFVVSTTFRNLRLEKWDFDWFFLEHLHFLCF